MNLTVDITKKQEGIAVVKVKGEMDVYTAPEVRKKVEELVKENHQKIIMDVSELSYIDSTGLGVLVASLTHTKKKDGNLVLMSPTKPVAKLIRIIGLEDTLVSCSDEATALAALSTA